MRSGFECGAGQSQRKVPLTRSPLKVWLCSALSVLSSGASALTVTDSVAAPIFRVTSIPLYAPPGLQCLPECIC